MAGVLVDTSVWVDVLRDRNSALGGEIASLLGGPVRIVTTGLVVQEVLQGVSVPRQVAQVATLFVRLRYLSPSRPTHQRAASLYRKLRTRGITVPSVDVLLAQLALDHGVRIWSLEGHFAAIASASKLRLHHPATAS